MLQRIQTIWLLAASIAAFLTLKFSFFSGNKLVNNVKQFVTLNAMSNIIIMILTVALAVAALIIIFLYKDRKMQLKLVFATTGVAFLNVTLYYLQTKNFVDNEGSYSLTSILAVVIPTFLLLAARGIYKDEQLVKSVDRLR
jgi:Domain of unknown function (DUF4293)